MKHILWFKQISKNDVRLVGGKNASLGEMFNKLRKKGINVPDGFAITTKAYSRYLKANKIDKKLNKLFKEFRPKSLAKLQKTGKTARDMIMEGEFPEDLKKDIIKAYKKLDGPFAVRSSGIAEDQPKASFAGQFESFLNVSGEQNLLKAVKKCFASTFNDRLIAYRQEKGFSQLKFGLSVGVQKMVRSASACSGVMFTLDTESGFSDVVLINSIWGVGEMIVKGKITPDQFYVYKPTLEQGYKSIIVKNLGRKNRKYVFGKDDGLKEVVVPRAKQLKFSLSDNEILKLAQWAVIIEKHYKTPQDLEWAKDSRTNELFIVQARPETVHAPKSKESNSFQEYKIKTKKKPILTGIAIGDKVGSGRVKIIRDVSKMTEFEKGEVLITKMTDPDWVPIMRLASGIITEQGGRTCHAAIIARELGIPTIVGAQQATKLLKTGQDITVDCSQGLNGRIYQGKIPFEIKKYNLKKIPKLKTKIMLNIGAPEIAFKSSFLPNDGVGLARVEFILAEKIRVHPLALYHFNDLEDEGLRRKIEKITIEHKNKQEYFIKELAEGIGQIAAAFYPKEVIVRFSDLKTNEYRNLIGGELFEGEEANPMLGFRGAARYLDKDFQPAFKMECQAIKRVIDDFGLKNISVMVPFCRTVEEGREVKKLISKFDLKDVNIYVMCEIPSNVLLAEQFLFIFDGMSIGSNDLTQLALGIDRDNAKISYIADETNPAVKKMLSRVIKLCREKKKYCGICGDAPSSLPGFAEFLVKQGIESISLNPDTAIKTTLQLSKL